MPTEHKEYQIEIFLNPHLGDNQNESLRRTRNLLHRNNWVRC